MRAVVRRPVVAAVLLALLPLAACGDDGDDGDDAEAGAGAGSAASTTAGTTGEVTVLAAASLTDAFEAIAADLEGANPGLTVTLSFGASSALAEQVVAGAPADVFAAASPATMATVTDAGLADGEPVVFARNVLEIAVPPGNPGRVSGVADFARAELRLALCDPQVPCGAASGRVFDAAGVVPQPDTLESDVRATLSKVQLGEVDAALVYATDVLAAGDQVEGIPFPEADTAVNDYPIAVLADAPNAAGARAFVDAVLGPEGTAVLEEAGFRAP